MKFSSKPIKRFFKKMYQAWNEPPDHVLNKNVSLRAALASDWREILIIDVLVWAFLLSSIEQMAFVFGKGNPGFFSYTKSIGLDGVIWVLSRSLAKSSVLADRLAIFIPETRRRKSPESKTRIWERLIENANWSKIITQSILWAGLFVFLFMTTSFNMVYERWDFNAPGGVIRLLEPKTTGESFVRNMSSIYIAPVVVFLSFVRMLATKNISTTYRETEEKIETVDREAEHRERERIRQRERRAREKAARELERAAGQKTKKGTRKKSLRELPAEKPVLKQTRAG